MTIPGADREIEEHALLSGPEAGDLLAAALATDGLQLGQWKVHSLHHRPGAGVTVGYIVHLAGVDSAIPPLYLYATTAKLTVPDAAAVHLTSSDGYEVHVWRHPFDPELPAWSVACDATQLGARIGPVASVEVLAYRPTRRGVVRAVLAGPPTETVYVKIVRPGRGEGLTTRHQILVDAGIPAPAVLYSDETGLAVFAAGTGKSLAELLVEGLEIENGPETAERVFSTLVATLDALPANLLDLPIRPAWAERVDHYAHAATTVLPDQAARIAVLVDEIRHQMATSDAGPLVPTHGDFYEANVLMEPDLVQPRVRTLLDLDTVGPGRRVDDLACLLAHISVLPDLAPEQYRHVPTIQKVWTKASYPLVDRANLHARAAAVVLSLVSGVRPTDPRAEELALGRLVQAEAWLAATPG